MAASPRGNRHVVRPIPETQTLFDQLNATGESALPSAVMEMARRLVGIVPECVGLSLGVVQEGITMTLVASDAQAAQLDVAQYLDDGPCLEAVRREERLEVNVDDLLDEGRWLMYAQVGSAAGIASSLSLPVTVEGEVVGGVNLYASTPSAFEGHHDEIAATLGTSAEWAVTNADLSFSTRLRAVESPEHFAAQRDVDIALGMLAARHAISIDDARNRLRRAAARAGISEVQAARALSGLDSHPD